MLLLLLLLLMHGHGLCFCACVNEEEEEEEGEAGGVRKGEKRRSAMTATSIGGHHSRAESASKDARFYCYAAPRSKIHTSAFHRDD